MARRIDDIYRYCGRREYVGWGDKSTFAIECILSDDPFGQSGAVYGSPIIWISGYGMGDPKEETTLGGFAQFLRSFLAMPDSGLECFSSMPPVQLFQLACRAMYEPDDLDIDVSASGLYERLGGCFFNDNSTVLDGYWCIWQRVGDDVRFVAIPYFLHGRDFVIDKQVNVVEARVPFERVTDIMNACLEWIANLCRRSEEGRQ